jgi:muramoyltetrapeptide carboxypeptidase LdcA involved in peptidoglycan recycling
MFYPENLKKGYKIGVSAPSAGMSSIPDQARLESGIRHFQELGYPVILTEHVSSEERGASASGKIRAKELTELFQNPEVRAVIAASGGDFLMQMLSELDLDVIKRNPKWLQGFSDITGLVFTVTTNLDIATLYANNFSAFGMKNWHSSLYENIRIIEGENPVQHSFDFYQDGYRPRITGLEEFETDTPVKWINFTPEGRLTEEELVMSGRMLGGNLDVCLNLVGTRFDQVSQFIHRYQEDKILWFLESYSLDSSELIRGLWQLKEAGWFQNAAGFIFGRPAIFTEQNGITYTEAIQIGLEELHLPVILDADIGHKSPQMTIINGAIAKIKSSGGKGSITFKRR